MAEWIAGGEPELDLWAMDVRRFGAHYRSPGYTVERVARGLRDLLRHQVPQPRALGRPAAARLAGLRLAPRARRRVRREVRLGARELVRRQRGRGRRVAAPARVGRHALVAGDRRRAHRLPRGRGAVRRDVVRQDRGERAGRRRAARAPVRQPRGARGRPDHLHADAQPRAAGSSATSRSRAWPRTGSGSSPAPRSAATTSPGSPSHAGAGVRVEDVTSRWACAGLWGPKARDVLAAATTDDLDFGYMRWRELTVGDVPVRALRVTYVGELGWELYCPMEFGSALWRTLWEAGQPHGLRRGRLPGDRLAAAGEGLPRVGRRHHARRHAVRGRPRFLRAGRQGLPRQGRARRAARPAAVLPARSPIRARSRSATSRCAPAARSPAASPAAATATRWGARSPTRTCRPSTPQPGTEIAVEIFGEWVEGEVAAEPLLDPEGLRIR